MNSQASEFQKLPCQKLNHENNDLQYICMNSKCKESRLACCHCLIDQHSDHCKDNMLIKQFLVLVKGKYEDRFKRMTDLNKNIQNLDDKNKITEFETTLLDECDKIKESLCLVIEQFKQSIPIYIKKVDDMKRQSEIYESFSQIRQTQSINKLFQQWNYLDLKDELKIQEYINIYFDQGYDTDVDTALEDMRNYQSNLDELRKQTENNLNLLNKTKIQMEIDLQKLLKQTGMIINASVDKVLENTNNDNRLGLESVNTTLLEIENNYIQRQTIQQKQNNQTFYQKISNSNLISDNPLMQKSQKFEQIEQGFLSLDRKYLKKDKTGNLVSVCKHYVSNYIALYNCCQKQYPCYICHDVQENHKHMQVQGALCLHCKALSSDFSKCKACSKKFKMIM